MLFIPDIFQIFITGLMVIVPTCVIYKKAGFNPAWGALVFLPGFGLILIFLQLAFVSWSSNGTNEEKE